MAEFSSDDLVLAFGCLEEVFDEEIGLGPLLRVPRVNDCVVEIVV